MSEAPATSRTARLALGLAGVALVTVVAAVIVVARREAPVRAEAPEVGTPADPSRRKVLALDVVRLDREAVETVTDATGVLGIRVTDPDLRASLGLQTTDVITELSGKPIKRQFDVHDVVTGAVMMNATALYVGMLRDGKPALVRWEIDGDLRMARNGVRSARPTGGVTFGPVGAVADPMFDAITKVDDFTYQVPRAVISQLAANPSALLRGARVVPSSRFGQLDGLKLYAIRPGSVFAVLGLKNGDTLRAINGVMLTDPSQVLDVYDRIKTADTWSLELQRRNQPETIKITLTP